MNKTHLSLWRSGCFWRQKYQSQPMKSISAIPWKGSFLLLFSLYWRRSLQFGYMESQSAGCVITFILNPTFCTATATKTFRSHEIHSGPWSARKPDKVQIRHLEYNHCCVSNSGYWTAGMRERCSGCIRQLDVLYYYLKISQNGETRDLIPSSLDCEHFSTCWSAPEGCLCGAESYFLLTGILL